MADKLDAVIFGATGFTGKIVVEKAVELYKDLKWGIAGRNREKLDLLLKDIGTKTNNDLQHIPIISADINDAKSIMDMAKKCKLVVNCCGPYRFYGEIVVKACIEAETHHVDISGEPQYFEGMQLRYDELARERKTYVVSTCAFESVPADMGVTFMEQHFPGTINSIEMFWENSVDYKDKSSKALLHYGTWESAICAMQDPIQHLKLTNKLNSEKLPSLSPKLKIRPFMRQPHGLRSYFIPFPAADRSVVLRSQRVRHMMEQKRPVQFESYVGFHSILMAALLPIYALFLTLLAQFELTRKMLLRFPHIFSFGIMSHAGPTPANQGGTQFMMTFRACGWSKNQALTETPQETLMTRVSGTDPFYGLTSVCLLLAGKTILKESHMMPNNGGVLPPGAAFAKTNYIQELQKHGLNFQILN